MKPRITVLTLGADDLERARIGYNPMKHGRPSYHPLRCFEGCSKDFWHRELRPKDAHCASGTLDLFEASFA